MIQQNSVNVKLSNSQLNTVKPLYSRHHQDQKVSAMRRCLLVKGLGFSMRRSGEKAVPS